MRRKIGAVLALAMVAGLFSFPATAHDSVYAGSMIGYVNKSFWPGDNLFGNPLQNHDDFLSTVVPNPPIGTTVSLWDTGANGYNQSSTFSENGWSIDLVLPRGRGALLNTPAPFVNTFVGEVLGPDGSAINPDQGIAAPPPFSGPHGLHLLASTAPAALSPSTRPVFEFIVGRDPQEGEQFIWLDAASQTFQTTTFSSGAWDYGEPLLDVAEAAFFNLGPGGVFNPDSFAPGVVPIPEPSIPALLVLGFGGLVVARRFCRKA